MYRKITFVLLAAILAAGPAIAREVPEGRPVRDAVVTPLGSVKTGQQVGNLNDPVYAVPGWFWGDESYSFLFHPDAQLDCQQGFLLTDVHMVAEFDSSMAYPTTFEIVVGLDTAWWDGLGCWMPSLEGCRSEAFTVTIEQPGMYDLAFPVDCVCAYIRSVYWGETYRYRLTVDFIGLFDMNLVTDDQPTACTALNDWGQGWYDLYDSFDQLGNVLIYGDVVCCDGPVTSEDATWGGVKGLYR